MTEPLAAPEQNGKPKRSTADRILRASALVFAAHIALKLVSLVQFRLIGAACDPVIRDIFVFAFDGVLMTLFFIGEEALGPAFLPVFMAEKEKEGEGKAWSFANTVLSVQSAIIAVAVILVFLFPATLVTITTAWEKKGANPLYMESAPHYIKYMVFGLFGLSIGSCTYMLLNGYKRFFLAAFGDAAVKLGIVIALATAYAMKVEMKGSTAATVFIIGAITGSVFKLITHAIGLRDKLRFFRPRLDLKDPAFRKFVALVLPLLCGILIAKVRDYFNNIYVMTNVDDGLLSIGAWGRKIYQTIGHVIPYAVSIAMLPFFCELYDKGKKEELGAMLTKSSRLIFLMCAPIAAGAVVLSLPLSQILYQAGKFSYHDCELAAAANSCFSLVLPFYALEYVLMQAFFSNRKMIAVSAVGVFFSFFSMAIAYVCVIQLKFTGVDALIAVALAFTVTRTLKVITLASIARKFLPCYPVKETLSFILRVIIVALGTGLAAWITRSFYESIVLVSEATRAMDILVKAGLDLILSASAGAITALALTWILCRSELVEIKEWVSRKVKGRLPKREAKAQEQVAEE
ncbi:MAG: hypothetical protein JXR97_08110 [Planctomycetes bacterium]|nr:hypothetical protein [Planctomycetota bacterium]